MKASDTVMPFSQIEAIDLKNAESNFTDALYDVAREQAEISFKVGMEYSNKEAYNSGVYNGYAEGLACGIKEVVEWVHNHSGSLDGQRIEWHKQLKEWGIE